jgi:flagellar basal-body rod protein FlgC
MGMFDNYNISASAMQAQKFRVDIINTNIANSNTVMTENGEGPYKRRDVIFKENYINKQNQEQVHNNQQMNNKYLSGVKVEDVFVDESYKMVYEPHNPYADKKGYVKYPNINVIKETSDLIDAQSAYEANINAYKNKKNIDLLTINLLKN